MIKKLFKALVLSLTLLTMSFSAVSISGQAGPEMTKKEAGGTTMNGWSVDFSNGASGSSNTNDGFINIDVVSAGTSDWHAKLAKYGTSAVAGKIYTMTMVMKASTAIKANYRIVDQTNGKDSSTWWMDITTSFAAYSQSYAPTSNSSNVEYLLQFGGDSGWPANLAGNFSITIEKITIETKTPSALYSENFTSGTGGYSDTYSDGAAGSLSSPSANLVHTITNYGAGNSWNIHLVKNTGLNLTNGTLYRFDMDVSVTASQNFEACFEDSRLSWEYRAGFNNGTWNTGTTHYTYIFTASTDLTGLHLHFQLGQTGTSNAITIDNVAFSNYVSTFEETRPGYYVSEFAEVLAGYDTCSASETTGYNAAPTLKATYFDKLLDSPNLSTTYVTDYAYNLGDGTDPKTPNAVTVDVKWVAMVLMYNANNGSNPDIALAGNTGVSSNVTLFGGSNISVVLIIAVLGINALVVYYLASRRKPVER